MKKISCCVICFDVDVDDKPLSSQTEITKLMLIAWHSSNLINIETFVCPNCRIFAPKEFCDKILEKYKKK